jgi:hypothetical protein
MVYDEALFKFSKSAEVEFLPWRVWISFWALIIAALVACFQGSFVVKFFTKFTKDIFASFIATVFIYEALLKTAGVSLKFKKLQGRDSPYFLGLIHVLLLTLGFNILRF